MSDGFASSYAGEALTRSSEHRPHSYAERLAARVAATGSYLCVGLDPSSAACELLATSSSAGSGRDLGGSDLPSRSTRQTSSHGDDPPSIDRRVTRAAAIERLCCAIIDVAAPYAAAVKPQLAHFEAAGSPGIAALERVVDHARAAGLLVVLDAKRCDIPHSAAAYAEAWLGSGASSGIAGDALTVAVWPGRDTLAAFAEIAEARSCGIYALVLTSNAGADDWLTQPTTRAGEPLWHDVARAVADCGNHVGAVIGATRPDDLSRARELMPRSALLMPGIGAQGGSIDALARVASTTAVPALVNASRSLLPAETLDVRAFGAAVATRAMTLSGELARVLAPSAGGTVAKGPQRRLDSRA